MVDKNTPRFPTAIEEHYAKKVIAVFKNSYRLVAAALKPMMKQWPTEDADLDLVDPDLATAARNGSTILRRYAVGSIPKGPVNQAYFKELEAYIEIALGNYLSTNPAGPAINTASNEVDRFVHNELGRVLPIDVRKNVPGLAKKIDIWRDTNVELVTSIEDELLPQLSELIEESHAMGRSARVLEKRIMERFAVSQSRAELIARNEIGNLNGQIAKSRQEDAGIKKYRWIVTRDGRERDSHKKAGTPPNNVYAWSKPPKIDGERVHPGEPINCRCSAAPILSF